MKTLLLILILLPVQQVFAWYVPGPGWGYGMGDMPFIPGPTFNYQQTIIVQEPPPPAQVIIREPPPRVIVEEREVVREVCDFECERLGRYFRKH